MVLTNRLGRIRESSTEVTWPGLQRKPVAEADEDPEQMSSSGCWKSLPPNRKLCLRLLASRVTQLGQHDKETQELTDFQNSHCYSQIYLKPKKTIELAPMQEEGPQAAGPAGRSTTNK